MQIQNQQKHVSVSIKIHIVTKYTISRSKSDTKNSEIDRLILNSRHAQFQQITSPNAVKSQLKKHYKKMGKKQLVARLIVMKQQNLQYRLSQSRNMCETVEINVQNET